MAKKPKERTTRKVCDFGPVGRHYRNEIHQQEYGNRNFVVVAFYRDEKSPEWGYPRVCEGGQVVTVFTKDDSCGRNEYAEELDIELSDRWGRVSVAHIKRIAAAVLAAEYEPGLRLVKVARRVGMFF